MNSTFVIGKGNKLIQSQYIGDLSKLSVQNSYQDILTDFEKLFRFKPSKIICDLHPDYFSSLLAEKIADQFCIPLFKAQHHHAHAVACMEEHNLSGNILSVILDGSGYGPDNKIWGGEFLICDKTLYKRVDHFKYIPLPGNEKAVKEPWRMAIAYSESYNVNLPDSFYLRIKEQNIDIVKKMINRNINTSYG